MRVRRRPKSRAKEMVEAAALACLHRGQRNDALKILMDAYGEPIQGFALRIVRDREQAKDIHQQVFLDAYLGFGRFAGRGTLWSWLCGIAFHRCQDELRRRHRTSAANDSEVLEDLAGDSDTSTCADRVAVRRALEECLGRMTVPLRLQLLMRCFFGLTYAEIGETVGTHHGTVQVRMSRVMPTLRRCLRNEVLTKGFTR
jgi:RNA polymerase sigma factor (sigma-70 family)